MDNDKSSRDEGTITSYLLLLITIHFALNQVK